MPSLNWFAVETRPRAEYAALSDLQALGLEVYLPQETRLRRTRKGRVTVRHPLMPGIVFVGSNVPVIVDVDSPDHPHPIFQALKSKSVRGIVRSAGGGVHPIRPQIIDGWSVNFVEHMRAREEAGDFDFRPREKPTQAKRFLKGDLKDLMSVARQALFPDRPPLALAA